MFKLKLRKMVCLLSRSAHTFCFWIILLSLFRSPNSEEKDFMQNAYVSSVETIGYMTWMYGWRWKACLPRWLLGQRVGLGWGTTGFKSQHNHHVGPVTVSLSNLPHRVGFWMKMGDRTVYATLGFLEISVCHEPSSCIWFITTPI